MILVAVNFRWKSRIDDNDFGLDEDSLDEDLTVYI